MHHKYLPSNFARTIFVYFLILFVETTSFGICCKMKGGLYEGRTASFLMIMLTYCLLRCLSFSEARDLRSGIIRPQGVGLVISSPESKPRQDYIREEKHGGLKMYPLAEIKRRSFRKSPSEKVHVQNIVRIMKENVIEASDPTDRSPGIGHHGPPSSGP